MFVYHLFAWVYLRNLCDAMEIQQVKEKESLLIILVSGNILYNAMFI